MISRGSLRLLHLAAEKNDGEFLRHFLETFSHTRPAWEFDRSSNEAYYLLETAAKCSNLSIFRLLLSETTKSGFQLTDPLKAHLLCHASSSTSQYLVAAYLLAEGTRINCCSNRIIGKTDWTPIMLASGGGHLEILRLLLKNYPTKEESADAVQGRLSPVVGSKCGLSAMHVAAAEKQHGALLTLLTDANTHYLCNTMEMKFGQTPLFQALMSNSYEIVNTLLRYGAQLDHSDYDEKTPLRYAIDKATDPNRHDQGFLSFEIVRLIFDTEMDILQYMDSVLTATAGSYSPSSAASCTSSTIEDDSDQTDSPDVGTKDDLDPDELRRNQFYLDARAAAAYAARMGKLEFLKYLYEKVPRLLDDELDIRAVFCRYQGILNQESPEVYSAYASAVDGRCAEIIRWLVNERKVPVERRRMNLKFQTLTTEIHHAASCGYDDILRLLIFELNASPSIMRGPEDSDDPNLFMPPIFDAAYYARTSCVTTLIQAGAKTVPNGPDKMTAFDLVPNEADVIEALVVDPDLDVNGQTSKMKRTILMNLAELGFDKAVSALIEYGKAKVNLVDVDGCTALHLAVSGCTGNHSLIYASDFIETIKVLIGAGADVDQANFDGVTPLDYAKKYLKGLNRRFLANLIYTLSLATKQGGKSAL